MSETLHAMALAPNRESAIRCTPPAWISAVMRAAHRTWRHETRAKLRVHTKASPRAIAYWMGRERVQMSADHLVSLMRTEPVHFVPAVLGSDAYAALARKIVRQAKLEQLKARQVKQRRLIERLEREAAE